MGTMNTGQIEVDLDSQRIQTTPETTPLRSERISICGELSSISHEHHQLCCDNHPEIKLQW